ncbi:GspH/FimT family pseudopilin [Dyella jiangningensis]|nr:GspH/FimT family pseudopilin [Dyella jiangningensis]
MTKHRQHGFTLVELVMTITIFVVLTLIAVPYLGTFVQSQRVKNAAMDMSSSVIFARSEAIKRNAQIDMTANTGGWSNGWRVLSAGASLRSYDGYINLKVTAKNGSATLSFGGDGRMVTAADSFQVQPTEANTKQQPLCVAVGTSGRVATTGGPC